MNIKEQIKNGKTYLGIELGSTRIKAVLTGTKGEVLASGSHQWKSSFENGIWTYSLDDVWQGIQKSYTSLLADIKDKYSTHLETLGGIGISAMMHGYLAFDKNDNLLTPFRTWANTITNEASEKLTNELEFNIPQRFSISHLYQAILNGEGHVKNISFFTTLAGYVHWRLTGQRVLGVGDASGMFPIDNKTKSYNEIMLDKFQGLVKEYNYSWCIRDIIPEVLLAGEIGGTLTKSGAMLIDPTGILKSEIPFCPPEGDAGTGMVATNSTSVRTGNISAGTSVFAMIVLEHELKKVHAEIDLVTTPDGNPVAMVHCNNCTS
ncbi:MAG: ATPase, partial [Clostridiales bacterium]|nr:ATPase [Clostridiales bacterium]